MGTPNIPFTVLHTEVAVDAAAAKKELRNY